VGVARSTGEVEGRASARPGHAEACPSEKWRVHFSITHTPDWGGSPGICCAGKYQRHSSGSVRNWLSRTPKGLALSAGASQGPLPRRENSSDSAKGSMSKQPGATPQDSDWILNKRSKRDSTEGDESRFQRWPLGVQRFPGALPQPRMNSAPLALNLRALFNTKNEIMLRRNARKYPGQWAPFA
jgi:hypothetical protein